MAGVYRVVVLDLSFDDSNGGATQKYTFEIVSTITRGLVPISSIISAGIPKIYWGGTLSSSPIQRRELLMSRCA